MVRERRLRYWMWFRLDNYPVDAYTTSVRVAEENTGWAITDLCVSRSGAQLPGHEPEGPPWLSDGIIWKDQNEAGVTVGVMKQLRMSEIKSVILDQLPESAGSQASLREQTALETLRAAMSAQRDPLSKARLAAAYVELTSQGSHGNRVHQALAESFDPPKSPHTIHGYVRDLRSEDYLTSAGPGRAGGALTETSKLLLEMAGDM